MRVAPLLPRAVVVGSLTLGCAVAAIPPAATSPQYTVTAPRSRLDHAPQAWLGRTVLVRALVQGCPFRRRAGRSRRSSGQQGNASTKYEEGRANGHTGSQ
jgi:hypothetical protein